MKAKRKRKPSPRGRVQVAAKPRSHAARFRIPPILREGDEPIAPAVSGPGQRYALGPAVPTAAFVPPVELPEAYGTQKIFLTARDPHWLYAHWDLSTEQLRLYHAQSANQRLVLRVFKDRLEGQPLNEILLPAESRSWFFHVPQAGAAYRAVLGYYGPGGAWVEIGVSDAAQTPPDNLSEDTAVKFQTLPAAVPEPPVAPAQVALELAMELPVVAARTVQEPRVEQRVAEVPVVKEPVAEEPKVPLPMVEERAPEKVVQERVIVEPVTQVAPPPVAAQVPRMEAVQPPPAPSYPQPPSVPVTPPKQPVAPPREWTPAQQQALAEVIYQEAQRRIWINSVELAELIRRQIEQVGWAGQAGPEAGVGEAAWSGVLGERPEEVVELPPSAEITSPVKLPRRQKGFWFNINAELVIYGATEPDARVTIGGRAIKLRSDGSFSYRFALPDGNYELPVAATSADGTEQRNAGLAFGRRTEYRGQVTAHPQDAQLKPPHADNLT